MQKDFFGIFSPAGTFSVPSRYLYLTVADQDGRTLVGYLPDDDLRYTTAEGVVADLTALEFSRKAGYQELTIAKRKSTSHAMD